MPNLGNGDALIVELKFKNRLLREIHFFASLVLSKLIFSSRSGPKGLFTLYFLDWQQSLSFATSFPRCLAFFSEKGKVCECIFFFGETTKLVVYYRVVVNISWCSCCVLVSWHTQANGFVIQKLLKFQTFVIRMFLFLKKIYCLQMCLINH